MTFRFLGLNGMRYLKAKMQQLVNAAISAITPADIGAAAGVHTHPDKANTSGTYSGLSVGDSAKLAGNAPVFNAADGYFYLPYTGTGNKDGARKYYAATHADMAAAATTAATANTARALNNIYTPLASLCAIFSSTHNGMGSIALVPNSQTAVNDYSVELASINGYYTLFPYATGNVNLGAGNNRWRGVYTQMGVDTASDRRLKKDIMPIGDTAVQFVLGLTACRYSLLSDKDSKQSFGFIAQDVEALLASLGKNAADYSMIEKTYSTRTQQVVCEKLNEETFEIEYTLQDMELADKTNYFYSLKYEQFIAPLVATVQNLNARLSALENLK